MKRIHFTIIALIASLTISAQSIKVYEYDENGNISNTPAYTSSKKVKVIFTEKELSGFTDGYEWVDLGLPSGTLWATCNIGANKPEEYGDYFAWGETEGYKSGKTDYSWSTYKWMNENQSLGLQINKYTLADEQTSACWYSNGVFIGDGKTTLDACDDAATVNWGNNWCMPTRKQQFELVNSSFTTTEWTTINGVNGIKITSKTNGKSIFFPAAGQRYRNTLYYSGTYVYYWSRELGSDSSEKAWVYSFKSGSSISYSNWFYRYFGQSVRPVRSQKTDFIAVSSITINKQSLSMNVGESETLYTTITPENATNKAITWSSSNESVATVDASGRITAKNAGTATIIATATDGSGIKAICTLSIVGDYVDLGLPSGKLWATRNVGAENPEDYGSYFAWGEIATKAYFTKENCTTYNVDQGINIAGTKYDAAYIALGGSWRMPTKEEFSEMTSQCTWTTNIINGKRVVIGTGPNGNTITIPANGSINGYNNNQINYELEYWLAEQFSSIGGTMVAGYTNGEFYTNRWCEKYYGLGIRAISSTR